MPTHGIGSRMIMRALALDILHIAVVWRFENRYSATAPSCACGRVPLSSYFEVLNNNHLSFYVSIAYEVGWRLFIVVRAAALGI